MTPTAVKTNTAPEVTLFLEALFAGKPDNLHLLLWTLPEKQSHWFQDVDRAIQFAESRRERDLYVGVGLSGRDYGASRRCLSNEVAGIVGLWADLDLKSDAHPKAALPATIEDAIKILPEQFPPTFVVRTGNGAHAWWLFREPLIFASDEERAEAANLALRWQSLLRLNAFVHGWSFDRLADLARVLRVPGTQNCKSPASPKPVEIHLQTNRRYNPSDLAEFLEEEGIPDAEEQEQAAQAWKEKFADKALVIDPSATIQEDLLQRYLDTDPRFKKTWLRQREDLKDRSQSGYDLALANFGFEAGLSEEQVVVLIIHHRRIHSQRPRTRLDYFQRTIAKAFKEKENMALGNSFEAPVQEPGQPSPQTKPDSATARALLCEQISNAVGVRVLRIVKIAGQEPTYRVELEIAKIGFASVDKLVGQQSFRMKIASAAEHLVPRIPGKVWDRVAQMMLNALTVEDGGDEADLVGAAKMYVERYLSETPFIDAEEEQVYQTRFKPAIYEGQIAIRSHDLQQHINKAWAENRPIKEVTAMLSALGATSTRLKRTGLRDQSRWLLPPDLFPPEGASREEM
jgi:RepB DNA-primase from phage plasmid